MSDDRTLFRPLNIIQTFQPKVLQNREIPHHLFPNTPGWSCCPEAGPWQQYPLPFLPIPLSPSPPPILPLPRHATLPGLTNLKTNYCLARRYGCKNYTIWAGKMRPAITARIMLGILHHGHTYIQSVRYAEGYEIVDLPCNIVEARWQLCSVWWTKPQ